MCELIWMCCSTQWVWYKCEMFVWSNGQPPGLIIVILLTAPKGGKAAAFNWRLKERWRQKVQIKQRAESGLESQPVVIHCEWKRTAAGITHLGLSVQGPHRSLHPHIQLDYSPVFAGVLLVSRPMSYFCVSTSNLFVAVFKVQCCLTRKSAFRFTCLKFSGCQDATHL